MKLAQIE